MITIPDPEKLIAEVKANKKLQILLIVLGLIFLILWVPIFPVDEEEKSSDPEPIIHTPASALNEAKSEARREIEAEAYSTYSYEDFSVYVDSKCRFYSGEETYHECLEELLLDTENRFQGMYTEILEDVSTSVTELKAQEWETSVTVWENLRKNIQNYKAVWKPYRDSFCRTTFSVDYLSEEYLGFVTRCKIYETIKYTSLLVSLRTDLIYNLILEYKKNDVTPATEEFYDLMLRGLFFY